MLLVYVARITRPSSKISECEAPVKNHLCGKLHVWKFNKSYIIGTSDGLMVFQHNLLQEEIVHIKYKITSARNQTNFR